MAVKNKTIISITMTAISIVFLCFANITPLINPFVYPFCVSLVASGANVYMVILAFCVGQLIKQLNLSSLALILSVSAVLILTKLFNSIKKFKKIEFINYLFVNLSQIWLIYHNLFSKTAIISVFASIIASNLIYYIYKTMFTAIKTKKINGNFILDEKISIYISIVSILLGITSLRIGSVYIVYLLSAGVIMLSALVFNETQALTIATMFSFSVALSNNSVLPFAIILIWCITAIILSKINKYVMAIGIVLTDILLGSVFNGYIGYSYSNIITVAIPAIIIMIMPNSIICKISMFFGKKYQNIAKNYILDQNYIQIQNKLNDMTMVFNDLSVCYKSMLISSIDKEKFEVFVSTEIENKFCQNCGFKCDKNSVFEKVKSLINQGLIKKRLSLTDLPNDFNLNCPFINQIITYINDGVAEFNKLDQQHLEQNQTLIALTENCSGAGNLLNDMSKKFGSLKSSNKINISAIIAEFSAHNLYVLDAAILNNRQNELEKVILIVRENDAGNSAFGEVLSKILRKKMALIANETTKISGWSAITYEVAATFKASLGFAQYSKKNLAGDNVLFTKVNNKSNILALCDGMGTGEKASKKSNLCLDLLLNYVKLGIDKNILINSINNLLIKSDNQTFSTLDMVEIDLMNGRADFIKLASSVSFIKRKSTCDVVEGQGLPMGIVNCVTPSSQTEYVTDGDFIVLCSDGIVDNFGEVKLCDYINSERTINAQLLAESILEEASLRAQNLDDMTCCVLKICKS